MQIPSVALCSSAETNIDSVWEQSDEANFKPKREELE
jgi:hypothetical protein